MTAPAKLASFAVALVVALGLGYGVGSLTDGADPAPVEHDDEH
ncbi:MAG TPA: hypothetical protein VEA78_05435 [Acidimicrobiales bacterium]|nr:hypothetical protein [Acidimicrobiales bacterium]